MSTLIIASAAQYIFKVNNASWIMVTTETPKLWEILLPTHSNDGKEYTIEHHRKWGEKAKQVSGGITFLGAVKGSWKSPQGHIFEEEMLPVRIRCTSEEIKKISNYTLKHYSQETVWAYEISSNIIETHMD
ncbi:hypothetical protein HN747_02765 [archaeon]|jgi:hypothetical protein|nr:hypothetical protein [archaeon]